MDADLARLCRSCGLCCDGSLFGRVGLEPDEGVGARKNRLRVVASGKAFSQACVALVAGDDDSAEGHRTCSIYAERPRACKRFACRLYDRHRREGGPLEPRLAAVQRVRELIEQLEGRSPRDVAAAPSDDFVELVRALDEHFARA